MSDWVAVAVDTVEALVDSMTYTDDVVDGSVPDAAAELVNCSVPAEPAELVDGSVLDIPAELVDGTSGV